MVNIRGFARLSTIAVGLGIGAAVAQAPVASADTSSEWWSSIDSLLVGGTLPAETTSALDYQISFDGYDLFPTTGNLATATTNVGEYGLAIAFGDGASATATGGIGNIAVDIGTNTGESDGASASGGNGNIAVDIGNNSGLSDGASAFNGNGNVAIDIGNNTNLSDEVGAFGGNANTAIDIGNNDDLSGGVSTFDGDGNTAIAFGTDNSASAFQGNGNFAEVIGAENSSAGVTAGDHNIAYVLDPFGSTATTAFSGDGSHDLAAVLFTDGSALAQNGDFLYDIVSSLGHETGALPTSFAALLTDLSALF